MYVVTATAGLLATACASRFYLKAEGTTIFGGGAIEIVVKPGSVEPKELPEDVSVDMEFLDANGEPMPPGAQGVQEGNAVTPPNGAMVVVISGPSSVQTGCVGCSAGPQSSGPGRSQADGQPYYQDRWIHVENIVPDFDGSNVLGNVIFNAGVRVPLQYSALDVYELVRPILLGGAGVPVPNDPVGISVDVRLFNRVSVVPWPVFPGFGGSGGLLAGAHLPRVGGLEFETMDVTSAFTSYDLVVNGHQIADDTILATSNHESAPNGWRVVRAMVPEILLDYSTTHANIDFELRARTAEDTDSNVVIRSLEAFQ